MLLLLLLLSSSPSSAWPFATLGARVVGRYMDSDVRPPNFDIVRVHPAESRETASQVGAAVEQDDEVDPSARSGAEHLTTLFKLEPGACEPSIDHMSRHEGDDKVLCRTVSKSPRKS